ncbi:MAG: TULIP family P47-like protein [Bacteroidota bacterium]
MNLNGWDTVSVIDQGKVNRKLSDNASKLVMNFNTGWEDGFSGDYLGQGDFGAWKIVGGSGTDIHIEIPIIVGHAWPKGKEEKKTDLAGITLTYEVNLALIPSSVHGEGKKLQFEIHKVTPAGQQRSEGGISLIGQTDPHHTKFARQLGQALAGVLVDNNDKISFIFAQVGISGDGVPAWLEPVQSRYSYHVPQGGTKGYLAVLSMTTQGDLPSSGTNIDSGLIPSDHDVTFAMSGDLFLEHIIMPALPDAFSNASLDNFSYSSGKISLAKDFDLDGVQVAAITYYPKMTSMDITIDSGKIKNVAKGSVYLDMPNAYLNYGSTVENKLEYDASTQKISFDKDPNPSTHHSADVPWYDYLLGLGAIGAAIIAAVLAGVESGVGSSLSGSNMGGSLRSATAKVVSWGNDVTVKAGTLEDCFYMQGNIS